ncbi:MAG: PAS domain S-box protein [Syntrophobacteraceae bacterium]
MNEPVGQYPSTSDCSTIFNHAPVGMIRLDRNAIIIDCNPGFLNIAAASREEVIGLNLAASWGGEQMRSAVLEALSGRPGFYQGEYLTFSGKKKGYIKASFHPVEPCESGSLRAVGFFEQITEQKRAEEENREYRENIEGSADSSADELARSNRRLRREVLKRGRAETALRREDSFKSALLRSTAEGLCICRKKKVFPHLEFTVWNERMSEITGYTREQINGLGWHQGLYANSRSQAKEQDPIRRSLGGEGPITEELEITRADGSKRTVRISTAILSEGNRSVQVLAVVGDITRQRLAERELKSYRQKLEILVADQTTELSKTNQLLQLEMSERKRVNTALEKANQKLQDIIDFLPDATFVISRERKVIMWNRAIEEMTGVKKEEILGKGDYAYAMPFYGQKRPLLIDMAMDKGIENEGRYTFLFRRQDIVLGETFVTELNRKRGAHLWGTASLLFDRDRNVIGAIESIRDISDRKKAEQELRLSEERFRAIFESARECIYLKDLSYRYTLANPAMAKTFGMTPEELVGKRTQDLYGEEAGRRAEEYDSLVFAGEVVEKETTKPIHGVFKTFHIIKVPIRNEAGEIIGLCGISRDITERKQMESRLHDAVIFLQTMMDAIPAPVFYKDAEGRYLGCNKAFETCVGISREDIVGKSVFAIAPPDLAERYREMDNALIGEPGVQVYETSLRFADGIRREVIFSKSTFTDASGAPAGIVGVMLDISERKRVEEALRQSESELRFLSSRLLTAQEEERKRLAGELHDSLGSSLTAIKISLEGALNRLLAGKIDAAPLERSMTLTRLAIEEVRRIMMDLRPSMLDDLGLLATIEWFCRQFRDVYPNLRVEEIVRVEERNIPEALKTVVYRVMQEAFHNVAKYSGAGCVRLSLEGGAEFLDVAIEDDGEGFDVESALSRETGTKGLGLTSMKERIELSGGSFSIRSIIGKGTVIRASWQTVIPLPPGMRP